MNDMYGPNAQRPVDINIDMAKVMGVFLAQLRLVYVYFLVSIADFHYRFAQNLVCDIY